MRNAVQKSIYFIILFCFTLNTALYAIDSKATEAFSKPNLHNPTELYKLAREAFASSQLKEARLYALRLFFDGVRNQNLLNLLGVIEIQEGNNLLAAEWLRRGDSLKLSNKLGQKYLSRLPAKSFPIPIDANKLTDHFSEIISALPKLLKEITNAKLHEQTIYKALERGQIYLGLALAEEYEKTYKTDTRGPALTALCAWYLGRHRDAMNIINQNLPIAPFDEVLLFVKAMISDGHPATTAGSYFKALYHLDQWQQILNLTDKYNEMFPNSAQAYIAKTRVLLDMKKNSLAAEALQEAGKREPGNPEIELLWLQYRLQREELDKAAKHVARAVRRGYHLPVITLASNLFAAMQNNNPAELGVIANELANCLPFSDVDAYSSYVSMLMVLNRVDEARKILDEWRSRFPEKSMYCYLEAFYHFETNSIQQGLFWLRRGFNYNPNRMDMVEFLSNFTAVEQDEVLYKAMKTQIATIAREATQPATSLNTSESLPQQAATQPPAGTGTANNLISSGRQFAISAGTGVDQHAFTAINTELMRCYGIIAAEIGDVNKPIPVNVVSADNLGPLITCTDRTTNGITVTTNFYDPEMVQNIIRANIDNLSDDELYPLIEEYPSNLLATEIARKIINQIVPESLTAEQQNLWLQQGLADILAASTSGQIVLRYRLLVASQSIEKKISALASANAINTIFSDSYSSPAVYETAKAQAYLMTAYLIKKSGYKKGIANVLELIKQTSKGVDFNEAVNKIFGITAETFEKSWKEAAHWALLQGTPYEWE